MNSPPPKPEVILTNFFAEPTVLLVPITSLDVGKIHIIKFNKKKMGHLGRYHNIRNNIVNFRYGQDANFSVCYKGTNFAFIRDTKISFTVNKNKAIRRCKNQVNVELYGNRYMEI